MPPIVARFPKGGLCEYFMAARQTILAALKSDLRVVIKEPFVVMYLEAQC